MIRYMTFVSIVVFGTASALAAMGPRLGNSVIPSTNVTVVAKNQAFPVFAPIILEPCAQEDCSDVTN